MNQEKINTLTEGLAKALTLVDAVGTAARQELGYERTRSASAFAVGQIELLLVALQEDWEKDERELDEEIENFKTSWSQEQTKEPSP